MLKERHFIPFGLEVAHRVHQKKHLLLRLGAVASVEVVLQWDWPLHGADHIDVPPLDTTAEGSEGRRVTSVLHFFGTRESLPASKAKPDTYPIHSLNSRAFGTVALRRMMLT